MICSSGTFSTLEFDFIREFKFCHHFFFRGGFFSNFSGTNTNVNAKMTGKTQVLPVIKIKINRALNRRRHLSLIFRDGI